MMPPRQMTEQVSLSDGFPTTSSSTKRTAAGKPKVKKYYAVQVGKVPGVYEVWADCQHQITGHKGAIFKSFMSHGDAQRFVNGEDVSGAPAPPSKKKKTDKYYGVAAGHNPGVYTDWADAQAQIDKFKGPKYKRFDTVEEALAFVQSKGIQGASEKGPGRPRTASVSGPRIKHIKPRRTDKSKKDDQRKIDEELAFPDDMDDVDEGAPMAKRSKPSDSMSIPDEVTDLDRIEMFSEAEVEPEPDSESEREQSYDQQDLVDLEDDEQDPNNIKIHTDGSSRGNGNDGARAGYGVYFGPNDTRNVAQRLEGDLQTNQRAELMAILRALEIVPPDQEVTIVTDSKYSIDCCEKWYRGWEKNNWMSSIGQPVKNKDLVQAIVERIRERSNGVIPTKTNFQWVKGHSDNRGNIEADRLAVEGSYKD